MGDNDKPFVCMHTGCTMRFANEDHLSVHRLKHEMSLALTPGAKPGSLLHFADQTPTPTKFLKNCEEIGLFNELTKNPFEEAFKKASETITEGKIPEILLQLHGTHGLDTETLHTPTPHHVGITHSHGTPLHVLATHAGTPSKEEFIPLPGPDHDMGSTIATTPGGSSVCGTPRSGGSLSTPRKSSSTPAGTPTSSSTHGLPFKLKMKREPLGETELSMLSGEVLSPSVPKKEIPSSPFSDDKSKLSVTPVGESDIVKITSPQITINASPSPAKVAMVTPTPMASSVVATVATSLPAGVVSSIAGSMGGSVQGQPYLGVAAGKQPQYFLQVMIQMPSGEMMPVQIPAALSAPGTTTSVTQSPSAIAKPEGALSAATTVSAAVNSGLMVTTPNTVQSALSGSATASSYAKQKLKAALQQSVLTSNMRVMSEAVERISDPVPKQTSPLIAVTLPTTPAARPQTLMKLPLTTNQMSPASSVTTPMSPDGSDEDFADDDDDDEGPGGKRLKSEEQDPDIRRKKFLERNRAAAARCRQKKKMWIGNLEKKAEELQNTNSKLQQEVTMLRSEVAQLKTLLLAHKDCPITLQLQSSGVITQVTSSETQSNSVSSTSLHPVTIATNSSAAVSTSSFNSSRITQALHSFQSGQPIIIEFKSDN